MGAFVIPGLVVLSALVVFAGIAAADDALNGHFVGGITDESGIENADTATNGDYVADELLLSPDEVSYPSVLNIPEFVTVACPIVSILGLLLFFNYRKLREET